MRRSLVVGLAGRLLLAIPASADQLQSVDEIVAQVRRATEPSLDIGRARADGFVQVSGMQVRHGYHFTNIKAPVAGVEYTLAAPPRPNPLTRARQGRGLNVPERREWR